VSPPILRGLAIGSVVRLELADAREHGVALLAAAEGDQDSMLIVEAEYVLGVTSFWAGEFQESRRHLEEAIERYSPERHEAHIALYSQDPKVVCLSRLAWTLRFLGYPDQAVRTRDAALSLADELGHPFSRCYASVYAAIVSQDLQDELRAEEFIEAGDDVVVLTRTHGRPKGSEREIESKAAEVWTFRDGKVIRHKSFDSPTEALEAAELSE